MKNGRKRADGARDDKSGSSDGKQPDDRAKRLDDILIHTVQCLDMFIAQASSLRLGAMARILRNAKEELVYWAVDMNFQEERMESFINQLLYSNAMFAAGDVIEKLSSSKNREFVSQALMENISQDSNYSLYKKLRQPA